MWIIRISLDLEGENFSPQKLINELNDEIHVFRSNEPDDINDRGLNEIYGFGSLAILCPEIYGLQYEMTYYENWYLSFIDKNKKLFDRNGIAEMSLYIEIFHNEGQLNFEIFSRELLKKIAEYEISIPISYYKVSSEDIIEMLKETKISKQKLNEYIELG